MHPGFPSITHNSKYLGYSGPKFLYMKFIKPSVSFWGERLKKITQWFQNLEDTVVAARGTLTCASSPGRLEACVLCLKLSLLTQVTAWAAAALPDVRVPSSLSLPFTLSFLSK